MEIGVGLNFTEYAIPAAALAPALEARGFESVWATEHSHIPTSRKTPFPPGGELPKDYAECMDPFVVLAVAGAVTTRLRLGTGVCLVTQRDPIQLAKLVASIDHTSAGRFLFGIGNGWNAEEMADHGTTDFKGRHKLARERIEAMKAIWTKSKASYDGDLVKFGEMMAWPKPVQKPHPPILVGGAFPYAARRAAAYGDGWIPLASRGADIDTNISEFRQMLAQRGRDPATVPISLFQMTEDLDRIKRYRDMGIDRVVVSLESEPAETILPILDRWAALIREV